MFHVLYDPYGFNQLPKQFHTLTEAQNYIVEQCCATEDKPTDFSIEFVETDIECLTGQLAAENAIMKAGWINFKSNVAALLEEKRNSEFFDLIESGETYDFIQTTFDELNRLIGKADQTIGKVNL